VPTVNTLSGGGSRPESTIERIRADAAARASEEKYRTVLTSMDDALLIAEVLFDSAGEAVDYRCLEVNPAFYKQTGMTGNVVGRTMREIVPGSPIPWLPIYGQVVKTRQAIRFEYDIKIQQLLGYYDVNIVPLGEAGDPRVAVLFKNISARRNTEMALRATEERQAFLLKLSDVLRHLNGGGEAIRVACAMLGQALKASEALYIDLDTGEAGGMAIHEWRDGSLPAREGKTRLEDFGAELLAELRAGKNVLIADATKDARMSSAPTPAAFPTRNLLAVLSVPLVRRGTLVAILSLHSTAPREWTTWEVALAEQAAERTSAAVERTRAEAALRRSQERFRALLTASSYGLFRMSADWSQMSRLDGHGVAAGVPEKSPSWLQTYVHPDDRLRVSAAIQQATTTKSPFEVEHRVQRSDGTVGWTLSRAVPLFDIAGNITEWFGTASDVSDRKQGEQALRESEERQSFLLRLSDALRPLADPVEIQAVAARLVGVHLGVSRAMYAEVESLPDSDYYVVQQDYHDSRSTSLFGRYRANDFGAQLFAEMRAGRTLVVTDVAADTRITPAERRAYAALAIGSYVGIPLIKDDRHVALFCVLQNEARAWSGEHCLLLREVAERTWYAVERAKSVAAVRTSEAKYRSLFESIDEGFCVIEVLFGPQGQPTDYRFLEVNPAFERQTGLVDASGRTVRELSKTTEEHWFEIYGRVTLTGRPARFEVPARHQGDRWYEVYAFPVGEPGQHRVAVLFNDISERHRADQALRDHAKRQAFLLKLSDALRPLGEPEEIKIEACRVLGEHLRANRVFYAETDAEGLAVLGSQYTRDVPRLDGRLRLEDYDPSLPEQYQSGHPLTHYDIAADSRLTPAQKQAHAAIQLAAWIAVPLVKQGQPLARLIVHQSQPRVWTADEVALVDETAQRTWAAVERAQAEEALRRANEQKNEFLALLGHELRNPLAAIKGGMQLQQSPKARPESRAAAIPIVVEQIGHMERLIDDVLDLARIERGKLQVRLERINLQQTIERALEMVRELALAKNAAITRHLPITPIDLDADPVRLAQVLVNLLTNALKFSPNGGTVEVSAVVENEMAAVRVRDHGSGIPRELLPHIFDRFVQSQRSLQIPEGGLGLGLTVARQLVEEHRGTLEAFSEGEGQGAELVLRLPLPIRR